MPRADAGSHSNDQHMACLCDTWLFHSHVFRENPALCHVLGRPDGVHGLVVRQPRRGPAGGPAWGGMRLVFFDPCAGVAGSESGVSHKLPSRPSLDKSRPAAVQLARSQETMEASGITFQCGGGGGSSLSGGE